MTDILPLLIHDRMLDIFQPVDLFYYKLKKENAITVEGNDNKFTSRFYSIAKEIAYLMCTCKRKHFTFTPLILIFMLYYSTRKKLWQQRLYIFVSFCIYNKTWKKNSIDCLQPFKLVSSSTSNLIYSFMFLICVSVFLPSIGNSY